MRAGHRWIWCFPVVVGTVLFTACGVQAAKPDVAGRCRLPVTRAELVLTAGQVVPTARTEAIDARSGRRLYRSVCASFLTAPAAPHWNDAHGCPAAAVGPGTATVAFFEGPRRVDTVAIDVSGCRAMRSPRLGLLPEFEEAAPVFAATERTIQRAFGTTPADFGTEP